MAELHWLRPAWLLLLPVGIVLAWLALRGRGGAASWGSLVDPALRTHVLATPQLIRDNRWPLAAALAVCALGLVALAGPAWERLPVPAFRSDEALVVALDLSRSMDAADVSPSRLARAKLKLLDLLEHRQAGQTALIVFTTHAFTVTPLTTDTRTVASLVAALDSAIMPSQGSSVSAGLVKAGALLTQTGLRNGEILVVSDADATPADADAARELAARGFRVHVLAVGTEQGAPIAQPNGGFVTDASGEVIVPRLQVEDLENVAVAGRGRFARLAPDDRDLFSLFPASDALAGGVALGGDGAQDPQEADVWLDRGPWLVLGLLPLLALGFRRGWIAVWFVALSLAGPMPRAHAFEWRDLWKRPDQQGYQALRAEEADRAAELFDDRQWRGAAEYRAGRYADSAATLAGFDTADAHYNRGNALAKAGELQSAIDAYDQALARDPAHADAEYNRALVEELLKNQPQEPPQQDPSEGEQEQDPQAGQQEGQQSASDSSEPGEGEPQDGEPENGSESGEPQQSSANRSDSASDGAQDPSEPDDGEERDGEPEGESSDDEPAESGELAAAPNDVEEWASQQAADQWLRRIPQDPGGLLRRKFLYQYQRLGVDQEGKPIWPAPEDARPW